MSILDLKANYNAKCDNVTDDTTAIQNWLNAAGTYVVLTAPAGRCLFSTGLTVSAASFLTIAGSGAGSTQFIYTGANTYTDLLRVGIPNNASSGFVMHDFSLFSRTVMTGGYALHLYKQTNASLYNIYLDRSTNSDSGHGDLCGGLWLDGGGGNTFRKITAHSEQNGCADGVLINSKYNATDAESGFFDFDVNGTNNGNGTTSGFANAVHVAGGQGGIKIGGKSNLNDNQGGVLVDEAVSTLPDRELMLELGVAVDSNVNYGILVNDPTGGAGQLFESGWIGATFTGQGLVVNSYRGGVINYAGGTIRNSCGSGLYLQDNSVYVQLAASVMIQGNGGAANEQSSCGPWQTVNGGTPSANSGHGYGIEGSPTTIWSGTGGTASNGGNVLTFSSAPQVFSGAYITDSTNPTYIPTGCLSTAQTATTITLNCATTHAIAVTDTLVATNNVMLWNNAYAEVSAVTAAGNATASFGSSFTASQSTTNLVVTAVSSGYLCINDTVTGGAVGGETITALPPGHTTDGQGFCSNATGTYTVSGSGTASSGSMSSALTTAPPLGTIATDATAPTNLPQNETVASSSTTSVTFASNAINGGLAVGERLVFTWPTMPVANNTTANGNPTLHLLSGTLAQVVPGDLVSDLTTSGAIPANTYIQSVSGNTATMTQNAGGTGVATNDIIQFTASNFPRINSRANGQNNPSGLFSSLTELGPSIYSGTTCTSAAPCVWTVPDAIQLLRVIAVGPGGAGGSGAVEASTTTSCSGGGGGGAGGVDDEWFQLSQIGAEAVLSIIPGPAAVGGTANANTATTAGNPGTDSTANTIVSIFGGNTIATGFKGGSGGGGQGNASTGGGGGASPGVAGGDGSSGTGGAAGTPGGSAGGTTANATGLAAPYYGTGGGGGSNGAAGTNGGDEMTGPSGGGGGGGDNASAAFQAGGNSGAGSRIAKATGGATAGANGAAGTSPNCGTGAGNTGFTHCFGTGGSGGAGNSGAGVTAGQGKAGGFPGGGGGGSGCAQISSGTGTSPAAGNGGAGAVYLIPQQAM